jgi:hypothetical protein
LLASSKRRYSLVRFGPGTWTSLRPPVSTILIALNSLMLWSASPPPRLVHDFFMGDFSGCSLLSGLWCVG